MARSYGETGGPLRAELNTPFGCFFSGFCPHGAGSHILRNFSGISARMHLRAVGVALPGCVRAVYSWLVLVSFCFSGRAQKLLQHAFCAAGQTPFSALSKGTIFRQAGSWRSSPQKLALWEEQLRTVAANSTLLLRRVAVSSGPESRIYFLCHARGPSRPLDSSFQKRMNSPVSPINGKDQLQEVEVAVERISG